MTPTPLPDALVTALSDEVLEHIWHLQIEVETKLDNSGMEPNEAETAGYAAVREYLVATLAPHWPTPERPTCKAHDFDDFVVCRRCGQTEAAAANDCHHCGDSTSIQNGRCWWCLRPIPPAPTTTEDA